MQHHTKIYNLEKLIENVLLKKIVRINFVKKHWKNGLLAKKNNSINFDIKKIGRLNFVKKWIEID